MPVENSTTQYAFRIITNKTVDVPDVGLYNGEIRFITGRNNIGYTFENGDPAENFLTGYLIKNSIKSMGAKIDISTGGNYNTLNSCTVTIDNTTKFATNLLANDVYIINNEVHIYAVIDGVMYPRFGGVLNAMRYNEKNVVFECKDINELNFKQVPENDNKIVTIGQIPYVKLKKQSEGDNIEFNSFYALRYYQTTYDGKKYPLLELSVSHSFAEQYGGKADTLVNMYIRARKTTDAIDKDYGDAIKIISNSEAYISDDVTYTMNIILDHPLEDILSENMIGVLSFPTDYSTPILKYSPTLFNLNPEPERYIFDIINITTKYYISSNQVESIELDDDGKPIVYIYNSELDDGINNPWTKIDATIAYENSSKNPYIILVNNTSNVDVTTYKKVSFTNCKYKRHDIPSVTPPGGDWLSDGTYMDVSTNEIVFKSFKINNSPWLSGSRFIDGDYTTAGLVNSLGEPLNIRCKKDANPFIFDDVFNVFNGIMLDLTLPDDFNYDDWDSVYLGWGVQFSNELLGYSTNVREAKFYFDTLNVIYKYGIDSSIYKSFTLPPSNRLELELLMYDNDLEESYASQLYTDSIYDNISDSFAQIIFSPFMDDNDTITQGKQIFGPSYLIGDVYKDEYDPDEIPYPILSDAYIELEQDLKENMKFENNFVSTDLNGNKHMYLFPRMDVYDYTDAGTESNPGNLFDEYLLGYRIYDLHLICEKNVSSDTLYVKIKGEKLISEDIPVDNVYNTFRLLFEQYNNFTDIEYTNVETNRVDWDCARIIDKPISSKDLLKNLAQQSFVGIYTNREGKIELDAFFDDVLFDEDDNAYWNPYGNPNKATWIHDNSTIIDGSIKSVKTTNVSKIYNDINLNYDFNYASGQFNKTYYLTKVDSPRFAIDTITRALDNVQLPSTISSGTWRTDTTFPDDTDVSVIYIHALNSDDYDQKESILKLALGDELIIQKDENNYYKYLLNSDPQLDGSGFIISAEITLLEKSGIINYLDEATLYLPDSYENYTNIPSFTDARAFWENGHLTWLQNKVVNNLPSTLANCLWYRDLKEFDATNNGVLNSSIHYYMEKLVLWITKAKNMISYSIPINKDNIKIELLDRVTFKDILITDNYPILGWVTGINDNLDKNVIDIEITTIPTELVPIYKIIDEKPDNVDGTIDEQPTPDDIIDEEFDMWA